MAKAGLAAVALSLRPPDNDHRGARKSAVKCSRQ